jgi:hypothetical protein
MHNNPVRLFNWTHLAQNFYFMTEITQLLGDVPNISLHASDRAIASHHMYQFHVLELVEDIALWWIGEEIWIPTSNVS